MYVCVSSDAHSPDSDRYCIIGADLRDISNLDEELKKFQLNPEYVTSAVELHVKNVFCISHAKLLSFSRESKLTCGQYYIYEISLVLRSVNSNLFS